MNLNKYNIYEAFLYKYKKFIIAFSYTPGLDLQPIINDMKNTFNLITIKLDGPNMLKLDSQFNYDKLNNDIEKVLNNNKIRLNNSEPLYYGQGILLYGLNFPQDKINFLIDLQLHFSTSLGSFLKSFTDKNNNPLYTTDDYNKFKDIIASNKINKYFNIKSEITNDVNDAVFDKIIDYLEFKVYGKLYEIYSTKSQKEKSSKPLQPLTSDKFEDNKNILKKNREIYEELDNDSTDLALSIASDNADYLYPTKLKHTSKYINKQLDSDSDQDIESDSNLETEIFTITDSDSD
jgi:hypothetical protein